MKYYAGGYPSETSKAIFEMEFENERFKNLRELSQDEYATYLDVSHEYLVSVAKVAGQGAVVLNDLNGQQLDVVLEGKRPCSYIWMNPEGNRVFSVSYHEAFVNVYDVESRQLKLIHHIDYPSGAKCHCLVRNQAATEYVVVALGLDTCFFYDENFKEVGFIEFPKGSGPRHALYAHHDQFLYVISELSNELFVIDRQRLEIIQCISLMNQTSEVKSDAAAIRISQDEKHVYTSTRGRDLLTHFEVGDDGRVAIKQVYTSHEKIPRDFILTHDEKHFIVAYQESNTIEAILRSDNGDFTDIVDQIEVSGITCIKEAK